MDMLTAVLIVDDDHDVLQAAQIALAPYVVRVEVAVSLEMMEMLLASNSFDCVVLDMNFTAGERSGREGLTALEVIRAADPTLAVVFITSYGAVSLAVDGLKRGADNFLLKPWRNEALVAAAQGAGARTRASRNDDSLDTLERSAIVRALSRYDGNITQAAAMLGLSRPALYRRIAKYGL